MKRNSVPRTALLGAALVATAALMVGCGSSSDPATPAAGGGTSAPAAAGALDKVSVQIKDYTFVAATIAVKVGGTVTWTNNDDFDHSIRDTANGEDGGTNISPKGGTFTHTFDKAGTFPYKCGIHPNMSGEVTVS